MASLAVRISFVCAVVTVLACTVLSLPTTAQQQQEDGFASGGFGSVLWSVLDGCFDGDSTEPAAVCLKSKALTALDRAIAKPTVAVANGVSLSSRAGRSLQIDASAEEADRAALLAAKDPDHKNALLDDMLASRLDTLVSTKTIVLDGSAVQEGRGKKKQQKSIQQAIMMAGIMAVAVLVPMSFSFIALLTAKALLVSKIALVMASLLSLKKLLQPHQSTSHSIEVVPEPHYNHNAEHDAHSSHNMAYSGYSK
ncbi:Protein of unknown function DUF1676 [Cinara cedri]|uniref:Uncharacterized protein n=1 Tax=Cinara cedri TaxID=506608 RepID=A0A5E4MS75_9HEMI|nr:Protein of unknown function DUF1676 [Cinara cedri]